MDDPNGAGRSSLCVEYLWAQAKQLVSGEALDFVTITSPGSAVDFLLVTES